MLRSKKKLNLVLFSSFLIFIVFILFTGCLTGETPPYYNIQDESTNKIDNIITVTGKGSYKVIPDIVLANITIFHEEDTSQEAVDKNSITTEKVMSALEAIEAKDLKIQTISFNLDPLYNYRGKNKPPEIYAYRATTILEVSTTEIPIIGEIIAEAIETGANDISSLRFDLSKEKEKEAKRYALEEATRDGENKAYAIANSLDVEIDNVYYIEEIETYFPGPIYAREFAAEEAMGLEEVTPPPITPREIEVTANIQIAFTFK